ncbi:hypothetical protein [Tepidanaerobacter syntrophicus]|uniref:Uncharacterized protein n=1 Tax=Tepidanaerobacter syntrophicus TaxID=224999 RepID=A0A0U9HPM7_9FIRM|nr:hypothetical protein [Tepidanaerobacter syntrophicus]GAQ25841.1 hypothetical protein TSYNT_990 [Tepidanaerobacter syntrophicus]
MIKAIGIKCCGGCNSEVDIEETFKKIQDILEKLHLTIAFDLSKVDGLVILNGCSTACIKAEDFSQIKNLIIINGKNSNFKVLFEDEIMLLVAQELTKVGKQWRNG